MRLYRWLVALLLPAGASAPVLAQDGPYSAQFARDVQQGLDEATARRERSHRILEAEGVPILPSLPLIETTDIVVLPDNKAVLDRAIALTMVALKGEGLESEYLDPFVATWGAEAFYTPAEREFMADPAPDPQGSVSFSWRYASARVLFWSLGLVGDLGRPDGPRDPGEYITLLRDLTREELEARIRPRDTAQVLDQADLIYRYRWALVEAGLRGAEVPAGLDPDTALEWHWALNWLIMHQQYPWDDTPLDT